MGKKGEISERAERDFRAIRDMGLAAWWGSSLAGLGTILRGVGGAIDDPAERARVVDAAWKASRGLTAGAVTAYVVGVGLVRFEGKPLDENGVPRWLTEGPEDTGRAVVTGVALAAAVAARSVRRRGDKIYEEHAPEGGGTTRPLSRAEKERAERLDRIGHALHVIVPAATGWLMFSHLKQDMQQTSGSRTSRFRR
ncbi:hypothetical protein ACI8AC_20750 [Geodermatophilus sp. SYSU D00758]